MKYVLILILGMVLLAGCTTQQPIPTEAEIEYATTDEPLFVINESEAEELVENLNVSEELEELNLSEELTDYVPVSNTTPEYDYVNVDLTPNGVYDSATGERLDVVENETITGNVTQNDTNATE